MPDEPDFAELNSGKEVFDDIYNRPDPRAYYRELGRLGYCIPTRAKPVLRAMLGALREAREVPVPTVLDLGCSYGINGAVLKYDLAFEDIARRYEGPAAREAAIAEIIIEDASWFGERAATEPIAVVGVDVADEAVGYARAVGIIDDGIAENLEEAPPSAHAADLIRAADMVATTGCVGYVTERSFEHILEASEDASPPWIASFVLRMFPYDGIARTLDAAGYVTEKLDGLAFAQRRFASAEERAHVIAVVESLGHDTYGLEAEGRHYAEFFLSRPADEAAARPLPELLAAHGPDLLASGVAVPARG